MYKLLKEIMGLKVVKGDDHCYLITNKGWYIITEEQYEEVKKYV